MDFKSKLEPQVFKGLAAYAGHCKFKIDYETEKLPYTINKTYIPDFVLTFKDGHKIYIEAKGYLRPENRAQLLSVKYHHPDIDLRIVFQQDNKLNKNARMRYSDWATKNGFPFTIGVIPKEWFQ
jgi:hypothetical protein